MSFERIWMYPLINAMSSILKYVKSSTQIITKLYYIWKTLSWVRCIIKTCLYFYVNTVNETYYLRVWKVGGEKRVWGPFRKSGHEKRNEKFHREHQCLMCCHYLAEFFFLLFPSSWKTRFLCSELSLGITFRVRFFPYRSSRQVWNVFYFITQKLFRDVENFV